MTKPSVATTSLIARLVLPVNIIIGGKTNPSAATIRMTVTSLFSEPYVRIVTDCLRVGTKDPSGTMSKNAGVLSMLPIERNEYFPLLRNSAH